MSIQKERKLDIKDVLKNIDNKNYDYWSTLTDDQKKEFSLFMVMRYLSTGKTNELTGYFTIATNEYANIMGNQLNHHPDLQWKLLCCCGLGQTVEHSYIKPPSYGRKKQDKLGRLLLSIYPDLNDMEIDMLKDKFDDRTFQQFLRDLGQTDEEIKEYRSEFKTYKEKKT